MKTFQLGIVLLFFFGCSYKNSDAETQKFASELKKDHFSYTGNYSWAFNLMGKQVSTHTFYPDSIVYTMEGKVYATQYTMKKLSYEKAKGKWIGEDENGVVYALFFKEKTPNTLVLYKRKCKEKGLREAIDMKVPAPETTEDHGWNLYARNGADDLDILELTGSYTHENHRLVISDTLLEFDGEAVTKLSFHSGERRWVGKHKNRYLQVFFKSLAPRDSVQLTTTWATDLEALYKTKYQSVTTWETYVKQ